MTTTPLPPPCVDLKENQPYGTFGRIQKDQVLPVLPWCCRNMTASTLLIHALRHEKLPFGKKGNHCTKLANKCGSSAQIEENKFMWKQSVCVIDDVKTSALTHICTTERGKDIFLPDRLILELLVLFVQQKSDPCMQPSDFGGWVQTNLMKEIRCFCEQKKNQEHKNKQTKQQQQKIKTKSLIAFFGGGVGIPAMNLAINVKIACVKSHGLCYEWQYLDASRQIHPPESSIRNGSHTISASKMQVQNRGPIQCVITRCRLQDTWASLIWIHHISHKGVISRH